MRKMENDGGFLDVSDKSFLSLVFAQVNCKYYFMFIFILTLVGRNCTLNYILKQELCPS